MLVNDGGSHGKNTTKHAVVNGFVVARNAWGLRLAGG